MARCAADSAAWWRRALAWARKEELSARAIAGAVTVERFQGGDDLVQAGLDAAQVLGQAPLAVGVGLGDEAAVGGGLPPVDLQEHGGGLEVRAGQAGVGVRAVLLGRAGAVAVGEAVADPVEVVLDPFGRSGRGVGAVAGRLSPEMLTRWAWQRSNASRMVVSWTLAQRLVMWGLAWPGSLCARCCGTPELISRVPSVICT